MSQALYRKWRPQNWQAVIGQDHIVQTLRNAIAGDRVAHAYLFAGPRGTGKTTTARLLAKAVNCADPDLAVRPCGKCDPCLAVSQGRYLDLIEIDAASNTSVEDVRDLRDKINFAPNLGRYKVYIIDEVHMLSTAAFNALLKTLEEPPPHAIFILATTEVHKIPATVMSRCQRHEFRRVPVVDIVSILNKIAKEEGIKIEPQAATLIARQSTGAVRDAISLLDQLASTGQTITQEMAQTVLGTATSQAVLDIVEALINRQTAAGLEQIHQALDAGSDPRQFCRQIVEYLRNLLLIRSENAKDVETTGEIRAVMARHAQSFSTPALLEVIRIFNQAAGELRNPWQPSLLLELAYLSALEPPVESQPARPETVAASTPPKATAGPKPTAEKAKAQTAPVVPQVETAQSTAHSDLNLTQVDASWKQIIHQVGLASRHTQALLNSCKPFGVRDGTLFLGFNGDFAKSKMESGEHITVTRKVLVEVLGKDYPIRCFVATGPRGNLPPEVDDEGMVAAALRDLGGEIVDIQ